MASSTADHHFKVEFTAKHTVKASSTTTSSSPYTLPISNFDRLAGRSSVTDFYAYPNHQHADLSSILSKLLTSLSQTLSHYPPFAGRLVPNPTTTGEPVILCDNQGVEVTQAIANFDLASLDFHNPIKSLHNNSLVPLIQDNMPLRLQLTSFSCGGFAVAWSLDHALADATACGMFLASWAEIAQMKPISRYPDHRRSVFQPRSPPRYNPFVLDRTFAKCSMEDLLMMNESAMARDISVKRTYIVEASDIARLQEQASQDGRRATKIEAFSAYVWKVLSKSITECNQKYCKMGWLVEGRRRLVSYKVSNLFGNVTSMAVGEASVKELKELSISQIASIAHNAIAEVANDEHFVDLIDWVELHRPGMFLAKVLLGMDGPAVVVSSALQFPVEELDFGFGAPAVGLQYSTVPRLGAGYVSPQPSGRGDGSWVVFAILWPQLVAALDSDPDRVFRPFTATHLAPRCISHNSKM